MTSKELKQLEKLVSSLNRKSQNEGHVLLDALHSRYLAEAEAARANLRVYMSSAVGIGEHPDIVGSMDSEIQKLAAAEEKLATLEKFKLEL